MEELEINKDLAYELLEAIKKDDLKKFSNICGEDRFLNLCFGRFPILSICYLYESSSILSKYEKKLKGILGYVFLEEDIEVYQLFKTKARRSLRLYQDGIVSYMDMLAILGDGCRLNKETKTLDLSSKESLVKTYNLSNERHVKNKDGKIVFPRKKLPKKDKVFASIISSFLCVMIVLSSLLFVFLNSVPTGEEGKPYIVSTAVLLVENIETNNYVNLSNDISLSSNIENLNLNLDGQNHTITVNNLEGPLINNLNGSIKNLNIVLNNSKLDVVSSTSFLSILNQGTIENVNVVIKDSVVNIINIYEGEEETATTDTTYVGGLASINSGLVNNSSVAFENVTINGYEHVNGYLGGIVGKNMNVVSNCLSSGTIVTDTVDVAGIVAENTGKVYKCYNKASISQNTSSKSWNPNVAGIVGYNNGGYINNCINYGTINVESTCEFEETEEDPGLTSLGSGISAQNTGQIEYCINKGDINMSSKGTSIMSGGIAAYSTGAISTCGNESKIHSEVYNENIAIVGGLVGRIANLGSLINGYSISNFSYVGEEGDICLAAACGMCSTMIYQYYAYYGYQYISSIAYLKTSDSILGVCYVENAGLLSSDFNNVVGFSSESDVKNSGVYFNEESIR